MDFSNYEDIRELVRKLSRGMTEDDREDLLQEVYLKLLKADLDKQAGKAMVRRVVKQIKLDKLKKKEPTVIYDNDLVEKYHDV